MKKILPALVIFITGFITLVFEVGGARVLGPYFGTSVFVWTSLIGIIMGSLSAGYWLGGLLSIKRTDYYVLAIIISLAALCILMTTYFNTYALDRILKYIPGIRLRIVIASLVLFGPAGVFLGSVLPYSIKLGVKSVRTSGMTVGNFYALSTLGSILGSFVGGFYLIPEFGFENILYALSASLLLLSTVIMVVDKTMFSVLTTTIVFFVGIFFWASSFMTDKDYIDVDTTYNRVIIYDTEHNITGRPIRILKVNDEYSSAMFLDRDDDLVFEVLKYYRLVEHFVPEFKKSLMIGGSGYAFPKDYLRRYPSAEIDVVEIDPGLTRLAFEHFNLEENSRLEIIHEDGRTFLNRNQKMYDAVFMDAYKSMITIPYQLTTKEAISEIYRSLNDGGAVFANIISSLNRNKNQFLKAEVATYQDVFDHVYLFAVQYPEPTDEEKDLFQNIMLVGLKRATNTALTSENAELNEYLSNRLKLEKSRQPEILTDEYAPVEYFASKALK